MDAEERVAMLLGDPKKAVIAMALPIIGLGYAPPI